LLDKPVLLFDQNNENVTKSSMRSTATGYTKVIALRSNGSKTHVKRRGSEREGIPGINVKGDERKSCERPEKTFASLASGTGVMNFPTS
jgi:hypothetical protein